MANFKKIGDCYRVSIDRELDIIRLEIDYKKANVSMLNISRLVQSQVAESMLLSLGDIDEVRKRLKLSRSKVHTLISHNQDLQECVSELEDEDDNFTLFEKIRENQYKELLKEYGYEYECIDRDANE